MKQEYIILLVFLGVLAVVAVIVIGIMKSIRQKKQKREQEVAEGSQSIPRGTTGEAVYEGIPFQYKHFRGTDKAPPYFSITIPCNAAGSFKVTNETTFDRFFKRLGVCVEMTTHDPAFDDRFYITTDTVPFTRAVLERREHRLSIIEAFNLGFNHFKHDGKKMVLTWNRFPRRTSMEKSVMEKAVEHLVPLYHNLPGTSGIARYDDQESTNWKFKRLLAFGVSILSAVTGLVAMIAGLSSYEPLDVGKMFLSSLAISLPLLVVFTWLSIHLLKGRSSSHRELLAVFFIALIGFPLAVFGYKIYFNGAWDQGMARNHETPVVRKFYTKNKNSYSYYIRVNSWRDTESLTTEKIKVSKRFYRSVQPGETVVDITTKPGYFGYEWIVSIE